MFVVLDIDFVCHGSFWTFAEAHDASAVIAPEKHAVPMWFALPAGAYLIDAARVVHVPRNPADM